MMINFASKDEIRRWLLEGTEKGAKYCLVVLDSWEGDEVYDYPMYVYPNKNINQVIERNTADRVSIVEVYNLEEDIDLQIKDRGIKQKNFNLSEISEKDIFSSNLALLAKYGKLNNKDVETLFTLGKYFENGYGLKQDYGKAMYFYYLAAKKGDPDAENNIGWLYYNGYGVCQDFALARKWFMKAARKLNLNALNNLGYIYDNGM